MYLWKITWRENIFSNLELKEQSKLIKSDTVNGAYIESGISSEDILSIVKISGKMVE